MTGHTCIAAALTAALLIAAPATGLAQGRTRASAAAPSTASPRATPPAQPVPSPLEPPFVERGPWRVAVTLGRESDGDAELAGPRVGLELEKDLLPLGARGSLGILVPVGWFHAADTKGASAGGVSITADTTLDLLEVVPSFRASWAPTPRLRFFGEVGVGAAWATTLVEVSSPGSTVKSSDSAFAGVVRYSAGGSFQLNERLRLGVEVPTFTRRYGDGTSHTFTFSALAAYAF
jgi:hypothetical protein